MNARCQVLRFALVLGLIGVLACTRDRSRQTINAYMTAVENNDVPAFVRLADANARSYMEHGDLRKEDTIGYLNTITNHPVRTLRSEHATLYLGWVPVDHPTARDYGWNLMPVLVGEGRVISKCSKFNYNTPPDTTDWQVFAPAGLIYWQLANAHNPSEQAAREQALKTVDDALLAAYYFEGSIDARHEIQKTLPVP